MTDIENPILSAWNETLGRFGNNPAIYSAEGEILRTFVEIGLEAVKLGKQLQAQKPIAAYFGLANGEVQVQNAA